MKLPRIIIVDIDGTLTDGKMYVTHLGDRFKSFHCRDNRAIAEFIAAGFEVHLLTASNWPGQNMYADNLKVIIHVANNSKSKMEVVKEIVKDNNYIAVGDDVFDLEILKYAYIAFCPADADVEIKNMPNVISLETKGGEGVVAEIVRKLL